MVIRLLGGLFSVGLLILAIGIILLVGAWLFEPGENGRSPAIEFFIVIFSMAGLIALYFLGAFEFIWLARVVLHPSWAKLESRAPEDARPIWVVLGLTIANATAAAFAGEGLTALGPGCG